LHCFWFCRWGLSQQQCTASSCWPSLINPRNPTQTPPPPQQAHPPFRIFAVSKAAPIINAQHPRNLAWTSVSFPMSLDLVHETNQVMIGYGSGDKTPRVKMMPWEDVQALFPPPQVPELGAGAWRYRDLKRLVVGEGRRLLGGRWV